MCVLFLESSTHHLVHPTSPKPAHHRPLPPSPNLSRILASAPPYIPRAINQHYPTNVLKNSHPTKQRAFVTNNLSPVLRPGKTCFHLNTLIELHTRHVQAGKYRTTSSTTYSPLYYPAVCSNNCQRLGCFGKYVYMEISIGQVSLKHLLA
jgi:hypothetical protein